VTERLLQINSALAEQAKAVLDKNKAERHIRGGMATKANIKETWRLKNKYKLPNKT